MANPPIIEFKNVTKRFGKRTILDGVNLQIHEGQVTTIIPGETPCLACIYPEDPPE